MSSVTLQADAVHWVFEIIHGIETIPASKSNSTVLHSLCAKVRTAIKEETNKRGFCARYAVLDRNTLRDMKRKVELQNRVDLLAEITSLGADIQAVINDYRDQSTTAAASVETTKRKYDALEAKAEEFLTMVKKAKPT